VCHELGPKTFEGWVRIEEIYYCSDQQQEFETTKMMALPKSVDGFTYELKCANVK